MGVENFDKIPVGMPFFLDGEMLVLDENREVGVFDPEDEDTYDTPVAQYEPAYGTPVIENAEYEIKLRGSAPLTHFFRPNDGQPAQAVNYAPAPARVLIPQQTPRFSSEDFSSDSTELVDEAPRTRVYEPRVEPAPVQRDEEEDEDEFEYDEPKKKRASKKVIFFGGVTAIALVAGPVLQVVYDSDEYTKRCALSSFDALLAAPACMSDEFFDDFNVKNIPNLFPPEQN